MLENLIEEKREECFKRLKEKHPELMKEVAIDSVYYADHLDGPKLDPLLKEEFLVWDDFHTKRYWRSLNSLKEIKDSRKILFSENDLKNMTEIAIEQAMKGEAVANPTPLYSDVWNKIGEKGSPLEEYVTEEHKRKAVNEGFWNTLERFKDTTSAGRELQRIMEYGDFFHYFDFKEGAKKSADAPSKINFKEFHHLDAYMRWYLVQEKGIHKEFEEEKALDICGRLTAPIVRCFFEEWRNDDESIHIRRLISFFVRGGIIGTKDIQEVLGEVFEKELELGFKNSEYFSPDNLKICKNLVKNKEERINKAWEEAGVANPFDISPGMKEYIPQEVYSPYIQELRNKMKVMKRFDIKIFGEWMNFLKEGKIAKSAHSKAKNEALEMYFNQGARPAGADLEKIEKYRQMDSHKLNACLFCDFLLRNEIKKANEILFDYDDESRPYRSKSKERAKFIEGIDQYLFKHGKIKLERYALDHRECHPKYNGIIDFYNEHKNNFVVKASAEEITKDLDLFKQTQK